MPTRRGHAGFSLIEMVIVIVLIGIATAVVVPRFTRSQSQRAYGAARQLAADLEVVRSRAAASATQARMQFDASAGSYAAYLDADRNGVFANSSAEQDSLGLFRGRSLEAPIEFGRGGRAAVPGYPEADAISFTGAAVTFDPRGLVRPLGDRGVIYLRTASERVALAAVTVTGAGNVRAWRWTGSAWQ
jgi:prepilin-type N-terminal cleavage/methylation domain-containing protein